MSAFQSSSAAASSASDSGGGTGDAGRPPQGALRLLKKKMNTFLEISS